VRNGVVPPRLAECLRNPVGLVVLGLGAAAGALAPVLPPGGAAAPWLGLGLAGLSLVAYAGTALVYARAPLEAPEVRRLRRLRDAMAARLADRAGGGLVVTSALADAVSRLDGSLIPAVAELTARAEALRRDLARLSEGELFAPDQASLERLATIEARQRAAIATTTQQAANAYASILAMAQDAEPGSSAVAEAARWSRALQAMADALAELLDEGADWERRLEGRDQRTASGS
jgi:hypothetical protein